MGYRAQKENQEKKLRKIKKILFCVFAFLVLALAIFAFFFPPEGWGYYLSMPELSTRKEGELRIHFLDVGQGDCTLIELPDGKVTLVDGGDNKKSTKKKIMRYLNALDIDKIDHLVVTHTDKDHCGGLTEVFQYKEIVNAYLPHTYEEEDVYYAKVYAAALEEGCNMVKASREVVLNGEGDSYNLRFLYPYGVESSGEYSEDSSVLWLEYTGVRALFCGDADEKVEERLLDFDALGLLPMGVNMLQNTQILKVAHHGSASSTTQEFLSHLQTETAIVSCGKDNPYGHPAKETLLRLERSGVEIYRTDRQGDIVVTVKDGEYSIAAA